MLKTELDLLGSRLTGHRDTAGQIAHMQLGALLSTARLTERLDKTPTLGWQHG